jgi:hypothetical protein
MIEVAMRWRAFSGVSSATGDCEIVDCRFNTVVGTLTVSRVWFVHLLLAVTRGTAFKQSPFVPPLSYCQTN